MLRISYFSTIITLIMVILTGCGSDDRFEVEGTFVGEAPSSVRLLYYANGALQNVPTAVVDGKFHIQGMTKHPTIVEIFMPDKSRIATMVVDNGETLQCEITSGTPYGFNVKGNALSESLSKWVAGNRKTLADGNPERINAAVAKYAEGNVKDMLSTVLLMSYYDASADLTGAVKLFDMIDPQARPMYLTEGFSEMLGRMITASSSKLTNPISYYVSRDSSRTLDLKERPYTLIAITSQMLGRDSIKGHLKEIGTKKNIKVIELSVDNDSLLWRHSIAADSAQWEQGWLPGGVMSGAGLPTIPRLPYFILTDTVGNQLLRTGGISEVVERLNRIAKISE